MDDEENERSDQSLCAVVDAQDDLDVINLIKKHYPDFEIRFIDEKPDNWQPPNGRFP